MNIDTILLAEYASTDPAGKLTVVNVFNRLIGPGPKWGLPLTYLALVAHAPVRERGKTYEGEVRILNAKRESVAGPIPIQVAFPDSQTEGMPVRSVRIVALAGLQFSAPGAYVFEVYVEGAYAAATTVYIQQAEKA